MTKRTGAIASTAAAVTAAATMLGCGIVQDATHVVDTAAVLGEFADRLGNASKLTYTAEYSVTGGASVTLAQEPPNASFATGDGRFIFTPEHMIICAEGTCHRAPNQAGEMDTATAGFAAPITGAGFITPEVALGLVAAAAFVPGAKVASTERTIAGQDSLCANVTGMEAATTPGEDALRDFSVCVTADGVLASFTGTPQGGQQSAIELSSYRAAADPKAFTIPTGAKVIDVASLPGN
jgi:hypothetical protein